MSPDLGQKQTRVYESGTAEEGDFEHSLFFFIESSHLSSYTCVPDTSKSQIFLFKLIELAIEYFIRLMHPMFQTIYGCSRFTKSLYWMDGQRTKERSTIDPWNLHCQSYNISATYNVVFQIFDRGLFVFRTEA